MTSATTPEDMDRLSGAVKVYQDWRLSRGIAPGTVGRDQSTFTAFMRVLGPSMKVASIRTEHIDSFFLTRTSLCAQTQNLDLTTLRGFFTFLETRGRLKKASQLLADYRPLKYTATTRTRVPVGKFPALLDAAADPRERVIVAIGLYLFLRSSEIKLLRVKNVSLSTDEVSVRVPKTKDADVMPISAELALELRSWLTYYSTQAGELDPEWFLVPNIRLQDWSRTPSGQMIAPGRREFIPTQQVSTPHRIVQRALAGIGWTVTQREGVHTLRRSGARALYDELAASDGHSNALETVSAMLHHKVMATTQIYLGLTESRRKRDRLIAGRSMFPSLSDTSVTRLPVRNDGTHG